MEILIAFTF